MTWTHMVSLHVNTSPAVQEGGLMSQSRTKDHCWQVASRATPVSAVSCTSWWCGQEGELRITVLWEADSATHIQCIHTHTYNVYTHTYVHTVQRAEKGVSRSARLLLITWLQVGFFFQHELRNRLLPMKMCGNFLVCMFGFFGDTWPDGAIRHWHTASAQTCCTKHMKYRWFWRNWYPSPCRKCTFLYRHSSVLESDTESPSRYQNRSQCTDGCTCTLTELDASVEWMKGTMCSLMLLAEVFCSNRSIRWRRMRGIWTDKRDLLRTYIHARVHTHTHTHACTRTGTYTRTRTHTHAHTHTHTHNAPLPPTHIQVVKHMHTCVPLAPPPKQLATERTCTGSSIWNTGSREGRMCVRYSSAVSPSAMRRMFGSTKGIILRSMNSAHKAGRTKWRRRRCSKERRRSMSWHVWIRQEYNRYRCKGFS